MDFLFTNFFPAIIAGCVFLVIAFSELIKKLDKQNKLKGYRVYIPAMLSLFCSGLLALGEIIILKAIPFYWMVIFGFSVFGYEALLKKMIEALHGKKEEHF